MPLGAPAAMPPAAPSPVLRDDEILAKAQAAKNREVRPAVRQRYVAAWGGRLYSGYGPVHHTGVLDTRGSPDRPPVSAVGFDAPQVGRKARRSDLRRAHDYGGPGAADKHYTPHGAQLSWAQSSRPSTGRMGMLRVVRRAGVVVRFLALPSFSSPWKLWLLQTASKLFLRQWQTSRS